jgi:hypothetical protein
VKSLPPLRETVLCLVANFSDKPKTITQGQVLVEAESVNLWPEGKIERESRTELDGDDWEEAIHASAPHLTAEQTEQLIDTLSTHADMWNGKIRHIAAGEHQLPLALP